MDCSRVTNNLSFYLDGALDERSLELIESHLTGCPHCRRELAAMKMLVKAAGQIDPVQPPDDLRARIATAIRQEKPATGVLERLPRWRIVLARPQWAGLAGAVAACAVTVAIVVSNGPVQPVGVGRPAGQSLKQRTGIAKVVPTPAADQPKVVSAPARVRVAVAGPSTLSTRRAAPRKRVQIAVAAAPKSKGLTRLPAVAVPELAKSVEESVGAVPEPRPVEVAAATGTDRPETKKPEPTRVQVAAAPTIVVAAGEDMMKQIKIEASMRRGQANLPTVSLLSSRF